MMGFGKVSIGRYQNSRGDSECFITVEDKLSGVQFLRLELSAEALGLALTGLSDVDCSLELRNVELVGKERQVKTEVIKMTPPQNREQELVIAREAANEFAVDGWKPMISAHTRLDRKNKTPDGCGDVEITFIRHVDTEM